MDSAITEPRGDGRSQMHYVHDPVRTYEPITVKIHPENNELIVASMRALFEQQMLDPDTSHIQSLFRGMDSRQWFLISLISLIVLLITLVMYFR
jgi:hypothetical protein